MEWHRTGTDRWQLEGDAELASARAFERACHALALEGDTVTLELLELDVASGPACAALVDAVRVLVGRGRRVVLEDAPQELAHVLYRVGDLGPVELVRPRVESPTVA